MKHRSLFVALSQIMIVSMFLGACAAPAATPTATVAPAPTAFAFPTATTAAPTVAPTTAAATEAPTTAAATAAPTTAPTTAPAGPIKGGTLTIVDNVDYATLDPFTLTWTNPAYGLMYDFLVVYKPDYSGFAPNVADSWKFGADNKSVTFTLRPGVKFTDGTPMDAAAVKWNIDRYRDKKIASPASDVLGGLVTDVSTPDDHTVVLTLSQPSAILFDTISGMGMVSPAAFQKAGADNYGQSPVGTGPFMVKDQVANDHRTLTRNPDYAWPPTWFDNKVAAYPDTVVVKQLTDDATMYSALETGQVQVAPIPTQFLAQARANANIGVVQGVENGIQYIGFNNQAAPFDNKNIRQAIGYAINRDEIVKVAWNGEADPIYGPLSPSQFGYSQNAETIARKQSYNVDTAKKMLAAEGWVPGSDGILAKGGKKMEFRFLFIPDDPSKRAAETIQSQLADVGIKLDLAPEQVAALKDETKKGTHQMFLLYITLPDPRSMCFQFCSANIGGTDRTRFKNDDLDKALAAMNAELDPDKRKALVEAAELIIIDQRPEIPLAVKHLFYGYRKDQVGGMKFDVLAGAQYQDAYLLKP
jgi:peptide/nickel transport system substrate-binding protein